MLTFLLWMSSAPAAGALRGPITWSLARGRGLLLTRAGGLQPATLWLKPEPLHHGAECFFETSSCGSSCITMIMFQIHFMTSDCVEGVRELAAVEQDFVRDGLDVVLEVGEVLILAVGTE